MTGVFMISILIRKQFHVWFGVAILQQFLLQQSVRRGKLGIQVHDGNRNSESTSSRLIEDTLNAIHVTAVSSDPLNRDHDGAVFECEGNEETPQHAHVKLIHWFFR